jgi:hypothetical protein
MGMYIFTSFFVFEELTKISEQKFAVICPLSFQFFIPGVSKDCKHLIAKQNIMQQNIILTETFKDWPSIQNF